jgi:hypothetical protein
VVEICSEWLERLNANAKVATVLFNASILRHSGSWGAADKIVLNILLYVVHQNGYYQKFSLLITLELKSAYLEHIIYFSQMYILLDTRVFKSSQTWTRALRVDRTTQIKLLASHQFTRPKSVHATTLENDRCIRVLNIYFSLNAHKLGATWSDHRLRTTTQLTWLIPLRTPNSRSKRGTAQRWHDTNLKGTILFSTQSLNPTQSMLKLEKRGISIKPQNDNIRQ